MTYFRLANQCYVNFYKKRLDHHFASYTPGCLNKKSKCFPNRYHDYLYYHKSAIHSYPISVSHFKRSIFVEHGRCFEQRETHLSHGLGLSWGCQSTSGRKLGDMAGGVDEGWLDMIAMGVFRFLSGCLIVLKDLFNGFHSKWLQGSSRPLMDLEWFGF